MKEKKKIDFVHDIGVVNKKEEKEEPKKTKKQKFETLLDFAYKIHGRSINK